VVKAVVGSLVDLNRSERARGMFKTGLLFSVRGQCDHAPSEEYDEGKETDDFLL